MKADLDKRRVQEKRKVNEDPNEGFTYMHKVRDGKRDVREGRPRKAPAVRTVNAGDGDEIDQNHAREMKGSIRVNTRKSVRKID